jgi:hypothetical protein
MCNPLDELNTASTADPAVGSGLNDFVGALEMMSHFSAPVTAVKNLVSRRQTE